MADGGLGISTGIGQGEAQIIRPFQSPVAPQQYGAVMAAQQKAQADEAAKKAKRLSDVEGFDFKGLPQHAELFAKGYQDVLTFAADNIDDPLLDLKIKQKMSDLKTKANLSVDLKTNLQKQADAVQAGEGKNYFLGFDEAVKGAVAPIDYATFADTGKFGETIGTRANLVNGVKTVPIYDVGSARKDIQTQIEGWARANKKGASWKADDTVIDTVVDAEIAGHPEAVIHFERLMKSDPVGAKAANNDPIQYGKNVLKKDIKAEGFDKPSAGQNININNAPAATDAPIFAQYSEQDIPLGMKAADAKYPTPFKTQVIQLPTKGVELGGGLVSTDMYKVNNNGETVQLKGQSAPTLSYTQIAALPIATKDTEVTDSKGKKFIIKRGQVVQPDYKVAAKAANKVDIPTENKIMAIAVSGDGETYYRPAQDVARAIVNTFSGQKGLNYKGNVVFNDMKDYARFLTENGIEVQGFDATEAPTTGGSASTPKGDSRNKALLYSYGGKDYSLDQLIAKYGSEDNAKKAIAKFGFKLKK